MAQAELKLDLKWGRNLNANLKNFMDRVNSKMWFDLQIWTLSTQNLKCHSKDEMCLKKFYTTFILVDFLVLRQKLENVAKVLGQRVDIKGFDHFD
jgi:hypothetical protein